MAERAYIIPKIGTGVPRTDPFRPKYFDTLGVPWRCINYGREPVYIVFADLLPAVHTSLVANSDVTALPANLQQQIGAALATVQAKLEALNIPAQWVTATHTYADVLKKVHRVFSLAQRIHGKFNITLFPVAANLDTLVSAIPAGRRQNLVDAATDFGLNTTGVTGAMTLRQALMHLADQFPVADIFTDWVM